MGDNKIKVTIVGRVAARLQQEHRRSQHGADSSTTLAQFVLEALETWLMEHRSGQVRIDPYRHDDRNSDEGEYRVIQ